MPVVVDINNAGKFKGKVKQLPVIKTEEPNNGGGGGGRMAERSRRDQRTSLIVDLKDLPKNVESRNAIID